MVSAEVAPTVAMVWLHVLLLPHESVATQVRVTTKLLPVARLVTVLRMEMVAVPPQVLVALGVSKLRLPTPHWLVLFPEQEMTGGVVSSTVMIWAHLALL